MDGTGLYYYNARYYDPSLGRFISPDPLVPSPANPQALNRYSYCLNNPLKYVDPSGLNKNELWNLVREAQEGDMIVIYYPDGSVKLYRLDRKHDTVPLPYSYPQQYATLEPEYVGLGLTDVLTGEEGGMGAAELWSEEFDECYIGLVRQVDGSEQYEIVSHLYLEYEKPPPSPWDAFGDFWQDFVSGATIATGCVLMGGSIVSEGVLLFVNPLAATVWAYPALNVFSVGWELHRQGWYEATEGKVNIPEFPLIP